MQLQTLLDSQQTQGRGGEVHRLVKEVVERSLDLLHAIPKDAYPAVPVDLRHAVGECARYLLRFIMLMPVVASITLDRLHGNTALLPHAGAPFRDSAVYLPGKEEQSPKPGNRSA